MSECRKLLTSPPLFSRCSVSVVGSKRAPNHLDSLLTKCGYLLHPAHEGGFIFRALYSGCFVQKEVGLRNDLFAVLGPEVSASCMARQMHIHSYIASFFCCFNTGSHYKPIAGLGLLVGHIRLASNSQTSACLCLPNAGTKGIHYCL
jgi:hypothetical protein